jgi:protein SCO1/2
MLPLQSTTKSNDKPYFLFILVAIVAIGSGLLVQSSKAPPIDRPEFKKVILLPNTKALINTDFIDHKGQNFSIENFKGKWSILFFGFTNCPDICPTTMQTLKQVKANLEQAGVWHNYQVIMVSVDPERDTTERLANYVPYFDPEFIGISSALETTESFAKNVGILFFKNERTEDNNYDVDHGAALILVDPDAQYAGVITAPHLVGPISDDLISLAKYAGITSSSAKPALVRSEAVLEEETNSANKNQSLAFENSWIRPAPPGVTSMAAYFDLVNHTDQDIILDASDSPEFGMTMIHTTLVNDGVASMDHLDQLRVPANGKVSFAPLGLHLMLMHPKQELKLGDSAQITLIAQDGSKYTQTISVTPQPHK